MIGRSVLSFMVILFITKEANSFEVDGLRSGMSVEDALVLIKKIDSSADLKDENNSISIRKFNHERQVIESWYFLFCNNKLTSIHKSYRFTWGAAVKVISKNDENYGPGSYQIWNEEVMDIKFESISFYWKNAYDKVIVGLSGSGLNEKLWSNEEVKNRSNVGHISEIYRINDIDKHCSAPAIQIR